MRKVGLLFLVVMLMAPVLASSSYQKEGDNKPQKVEVINFPDMHQVKGSVSVSGRLSHSSMERLSILVPHVTPQELPYTRGVGPIDAEGFTSMIISLQGEFKDPTFSPGSVGIILVPAEKSILRAFKEDKKILFPIEVKSEASQGLYPYFVSESQKFTIGFPTYYGYIYNTTGKTVQINLFVYLTN